MGDVVDFIGARFDAWLTLMGTARMQCAVAFLFALLILDLWRRGWRLSWSRRAVSGIFATLAIFHVNFFFVPFVWLISEQVRTGYEWLGVPAVPTSVWSHVPVWILVPFAIAAHDLANYWNHRLMHMRWLWPVHAIHHSDPDVNGLTAYRVHLLEGLVIWVSYTLLLTWLGLPADAIGIGAVLLALLNIYVHIDVGWGHGPFRLLLASPRFHRWHHADVKAAYGKNLANVIPFYDWLFGTYYVPGPCRSDLGAKGVPQHDVVQLLLFPLTEWLRLARLAAGRLLAAREGPARRLDRASR